MTSLQQRRALLAIVLTTTLTWSLAACAPQPGQEEVASGSAKDRMAREADGSGDNSSGSWQAPNPDEVFEKRTELPESFPREAFVIPEGSTVDDAGERSGSEWFVVLRADDRGAADALWQQIIADGGFTVSGAASDGESSSARLTSPTLVVDALTLPQEDSSVLLSYDLSVNAQ